ncbi:TonB family protein [Mesorhizobium sp. ZMM04-5]|uniref:TonB family protein n=1 Tax=Mesorhizobium marinum TaxID=3228790 RepID=A0ABV3QW09_9HYPH
MAPAPEPAFTPGRPVWPLAGIVLAGLERDDPDLAIPRGAVQSGSRDAPERHLRPDIDGRFTHTATEPLGPAPCRRVGVRRKWTLALAASCVLHVAVAAFFIFAPEEPVLMEGMTSSGEASMGNAAFDQAQAGDFNAENAVDVTMITVLDAVPVKVEAETVPTEEVVADVDVSEAMPVERETLQPVRERLPEAIEPTSAEAEEPAERIEERPAPRATPVGAEVAPAPAASETIPEVLATDRAKPVGDDTFVQQPAPAQAEKAVEIAEAVHAERPPPTEAATLPAETVTPVVEPPPDAEKKPPARPKKVEDSKNVAEKPTAKPRRSGDGGRNQASAKRGAADGQARGDNRQASRGGSRNGEAGNAAVSNYPGKVRSKLARVARAVRAKGRGEVVVTFAVSSNGSVHAARIARSSGVGSVDQAALQAVRKAAPFPPIPATAGRSTWEFSIPLAFIR